MRLLTSHEIGVLKGDLHNVILPDSAELYVSTGLRQMFRRVSLDRTDVFDDSWLYIPLDQVFSVRQNLIVAGRSYEQTFLAPEPIEVDEASLYPILMHGKVRAVIANRSSRQLQLSDDVKGIVLGSLDTFQSNLERSHVDSVEVFLRSLLQPESTFDSFSLRFLNLLTQTSDGSCAGLYFNSDGVYTLRLVSGDLGKFDQLAGEIKISTAQLWQSQVRHRYYFMPADLLPPHPVFLSAPPHFRFVHPGCKSEKTDYLVTMIVGGDIYYTDLRRILDLARYASVLSDNQFVRTGDILGLYGEFVDATNRIVPIEELLPELFTTLSSQLSISRLLLIEERTTGYAVRSKQTEDPIVETISDEIIPDSVRDALKRDRIYCLRNVATEVKEMEYAKKYYLDNVKSEIYFMLPGDEGQPGHILAIGTPFEGDYLCGMRDFLSRVAQFMRHYLRYRKSRLATTVPGSIPNDHGRILISKRVETVEKLSGGYFHDIFSLMGVVCGQAEILAQNLRSEDARQNTDDILKAIERVLGAGDMATEYLTRLRELSCLTEAKLSGRISARELLGRLNLLTQGYARQIRDTKNVLLEFETHASSILDFQLETREIYDTVLPVLLAVMEQAVCSGRLSFCIRCDGRRDSLVVRFDRNIAPHIDVNDFIVKIFPEGHISNSQENRVEVSLGETVVVGAAADGQSIEMFIAKPAVLSETGWSSRNSTAGKR